MKGRFLRPSPALVVAIIALFVALGGTAGAVVTQVPPLAKRALTADNAKKLGGKTLAQVVAQAATAPGPASTAAGLVTLKSGSSTLNPGETATFSLACDTGQKVLSGGFVSDGPLIVIQGSSAVDDVTWAMVLENLDTAAAHNLALTVTCIR